MEISGEEAEKLIDAFKELGIKPKADSAADLKSSMEAYKATQKALLGQPLPRVVVFSGEVTGKGDYMSFDMWKYEVQCLSKNTALTADVVLQAERKSLRGEPGKIAMRLGTEATLQQLLDKLDNVYGPVELHENLMAEFYSSMQQEHETAASWGCRLESILGKAEEKGQVKKEAVNDMLHTKFWAGLQPELKDASAHKYDTLTTYTELLRSVRHI